MERRKIRAVLRSVRARSAKKDLRALGGNAGEIIPCARAFARGAPADSRRTHERARPALPRGVLRHGAIPRAGRGGCGALFLAYRLRSHPNRRRYRPAFERQIARRGAVALACGKISRGDRARQSGAFRRDRGQDGERGLRGARPARSADERSCIARTHPRRDHRASGIREKKFRRGGGAL